MPAPLFNHVTIIGLGLIGGSLARALKKNNIAAHITGCDSDTTITQAIQLGVIDEGQSDPAQAVCNAQLVFICTPLGAYHELALRIAPHLSQNAILTDAGSAKQSIITLVREHITPSQHAFFIPGHPIAGSEKSGINAGTAELFQGRKTILTPLADHNEQALSKVQTMWEQCGADIELMNADRHDAIYATVSHLPHLLGFCYIDMLGRIKATIPDNDKGFERFVRIAHSNVAMWRDILFFNKTSVLKVLHQTKGKLDKIKTLDNKLNALPHSMQAAQGTRLNIKFPATKPEKTTDASNTATYLLPKILAQAVFEIAQNDLDYVGTGFRDFTSPLLELPENLAQLINEQNAPLLQMLSTISQMLEEKAHTIENGTLNDIETMLRQCHQSYHNLKQ